MIGIGRGGKRESSMRQFTLGLVIAAGCFFAGLPVAPAASVHVGLERSANPGVVLNAGYYGDRGGYGDRCAYLRYKCTHKEQLDEVGEGNCRRYRSECGGISYCERLRRACIYKEERGEVGQGNCRRYRYECGGRGW